MEKDKERDSIVRWLSRSGAYPHCPDRVDHVETHISHVFLAGTHVYKLKKSIKFDFLDFSTVEAREHACREEVRLNCRLAPDAYLGVVPVVRDVDGAFHLSGDGEVIDWLVEMRRLPTELTLDALYGRGELHAGHIDRLAATLTHFYRSLSPLEITPQNYRERILAHVQGNLRELSALKHQLPRGVVERVHGFQLQLLRLLPSLFDIRAQNGRVIEGHGDLRPEHICLSDPLAIFDCIEFSQDLRRLDVADELAFLAAECDFLGATWVGPQVLKSYQELSGDRPPEVLLNFYKSYRACVRAKVAALRAEQLHGTIQESTVAEARRHLTFADEYAAPWVRPLVLAIGGMAGTGKTTLAVAVAEALGAELLRTDMIRRELYGSGPHLAPLDRGIYNRESRERVYEELHCQARALHADRISVVLDGTYSTAEIFRQAMELASAPKGAFMAIECVCRLEIAQQRIGRRLTEGHDVSDARPEIHEIQRLRWQTWPADVPQIRIDTERPLLHQVDSVMATLSEQFIGGSTVDSARSVT